MPGKAEDGEMASRVQMLRVDTMPRVRTEAFYLAEARPESLLENRFLRSGTGPRQG